MRLPSALLSVSLTLTLPGSLSLTLTLPGGCAPPPPASSPAPSSPSGAAPAAPELEAVEWDHGLWFDGQTFVARTMYGVGGVFSERAPAHVIRRVDLGGGYVVPPFGDAHHHGIDSEHGLERKIAAFLDAGIFYVKNPNVIPDLLTPSVRARIDTPSSIDVSFSNGGLTGTGGHPAPLHDMLARRGVFEGLGPGDMENHAYFFVDRESDVDAKWPRILAGRPDFIKTFLVFADHQPLPRDLPPMLAKGLDPALLPGIVARAHAAGLRVSTHVTSAVDFRIAVHAGVDEINHLPFLPMLDHCREHPEACVVDGESARLASARHIVVVSTLAPPQPPTAPADVVAGIVAQQRANFQTLASAGVAIALGSDGISGQEPFVTAAIEAAYLHEHRFADDLAILRAWTETTAWTIFPARKIGRLADGYEASFLVLAGDPLADFDNVKRIRMRVKQGRAM